MTETALPVWSGTCRLLAILDPTSPSPPPLLHLPVAHNEAALERATNYAIDASECDDFFSYYLAYTQALGILPHPAIVAAQAQHARALASFLEAGERKEAEADVQQAVAGEQKTTSSARANANAPASSPGAAATAAAANAKDTAAARAKRER